MTEILSIIIDMAGGQIEFILLSTVFIGVLISFLGVRSLTAPPDPAERRLAASMPKDQPGALSLRQQGKGMESFGLTKLIAPMESGERQRVQHQLTRAGFRGEQALVTYYLIRTILGLLLPLPLILGALAASATAEGTEAQLPFAPLNMNSSMMLACLMLLVGFYGPPFWLRRRIAARQRAIQQGFPHALDMMQVATEAGLGFDSALGKVAGELKNAHPALAEEFAIVGHELRAGKARNQVLADLADRTQVEAISVFTKVIVQSISFGTSIASTLQAYAREMRHKRMSAAEEKANQLPVKMSVIMVIFLLPTIFLLALSPVIIRLVRMFSSGGFPIG